eukprot:Skav200932  [mRNA]  locus=scaffold2433:372726:376943:+ [translate_table: standard]
MIYLSVDDRTLCISSNGAASLSPQILELCSGFGGLGIGAAFLGGEPFVSIDWNDLACDHLRLNAHGKVIQYDIQDLCCARIAHEAFGTNPGTTTMGFPCQPHSSQGRGLGSADPRHMTFWGGLRVMFLSQTQSAVLECVPAAGTNIDIQRGLQKLAHAMDWDILTQVLDLQDQWPCRRKRWWALCLPKSWNVLGLPTWSPMSSFSHVGSLFHHWGVWTDADEEDLQLFAFELEAYSNPDYGDDARIISFSSIAACFLHSYGNALTPCPCGCRSSGFSEHSLKTGGLRGAFIQSRVHGNPRYLHPREVGLLLGVPDAVQYGHRPREDLALLGLISSPLQMVWIYGFLRANHQRACGLTPLPHPQLLLEAYQQELLQQARPLFQQCADGLRTHIQIRDPEGVELCFCSAHSFTVGQLLKAERINLQWNQAGSVSLQGHLLPVSQLMDQVTGPCTLEFVRGLPSRPTPDSYIMVALHFAGELYVEMATPGQFIFEIMRSFNIPGNFLVDAAGKVYGADYRIWRTLNLHVLAQGDWPRRIPTLLGNGPFPTILGLHDGQIWFALQAIFADEHMINPLLIHPRTAFAIGAGLASGEDLHVASLGPQHDCICCIFVEQGHWSLLWARIEMAELVWTYSDGIPGLHATAAGFLADQLSSILGFHEWTLSQWHPIRQTEPHTCGTVAIGHVLLHAGLFGLLEDLDILRLHDSLLQLSGPGVLFGHGLSAEVMDQLAALLHQHGVPQEVAPDRAMLVVNKLGPAAILETFKAKNHWAYLKALASKPSINFRLVHADELTRHVEHKAAERFGAGVSNHKQKKKDKKSSVPPTPAVIDPSMLVLASGGFMDSDDDNVPQITFDEVTAEAHGIAICNLSQGTQLLQTMKSISCYALGLLVVDVPPAEMMEKFGITSMTFTATYKGTGEPILIFGAFKSLGDLAIRRIVPGHLAKPDLIATQVIKIQVFRDEFHGSWTSLASSPVKTLCQHVPLLQLCQGKNCGQECLKSHAAVDEDLDTILMEIWARTFATIAGSKAAAQDAELFWVYVRVPASVVQGLLQLNTTGIYFEPRDSLSKAHDERYRVIWLPAKTLEQAQHTLRTCVHALGLVRMRMKYGIRVDVEHEEAAFREIKPDATFINTQVQRIYQLFPLPHGLQRTGICKLLESFDWKAKPLQPGKGSAKAMSWTVGSAQPPPRDVLMGFDGQEILITEITKTTKPPPPPRFLASQRTQKHLRAETPASSSSSTGPGTSSDPWLQPGHDPWCAWQGPKPAPGKTHLQEMSGQLREELQANMKKEFAELRTQAASSVQPETEKRFMQLESSIGELQAQGSQFSSWFSNLGQKIQENENAMQAVQFTLGTHQQELYGLRQEMSALPDQIGRSISGAINNYKQETQSTFDGRFNQLEALLNKKLRTE